MRADTRSFSFTWMKGNNANRGTSTGTGDEGQREAMDSENVEDQSSTSATGWGMKRGSSGSRFRKLGDSLTRLRANRYSTMEEDEENWRKLSEVPLRLDEEDEDQDVEMQMEPDVVMDSQLPKTRRFPFDVQRQVNDKPENSKPKSSNEKNTSTTASGSAEAETTQGTSAGLSLSKRLNKTVQDVKASFGNFSQKFRKSTRRRYRMRPSTPSSLAGTPTRKILGRTPEKLYSPFGIETPVCKKTPKRLADRPSTPRLARKSIVAGLVYSPSNNFRRDLDDARQGMQDFHILTRNIARRSVRF